jgi:transposase
MGRYSVDLRERVINTYESGEHSIRQVAEIFAVDRNTVQAWINRKRKMGHLKPEAARGGRASQLAGQEKALEAMVEKYPDYTLEDYCEYWREEQGLNVTKNTMCRWLQQQRLSLQKTKRNRQVASKEKQQERVEYWQKIREVDPENLVFLDQMGILLGMKRARGRSRGDANL